MAGTLPQRTPAGVQGLLLCVMEALEQRHGTGSDTSYRRMALFFFFSLFLQRRCFIS